MAFVVLFIQRPVRSSRSLTDMLETSVFAQCGQHGLFVLPVKVSQGEGAK